MVEESQNGDFIYVHKIKKGETIYRLAKLFKLRVKEIFEINPHVQNTIISIGEKISFPIKNKIISTQKELTGDEKNPIPVVYRVRQKENIFRISRIYFDQPMENLIVRNKIQGLDISTGQKLTIGWIMKGSIEQAIQPVATPQQQDVFEKIIQKSKDEQKYSESENLPVKTIVKVDLEEAKIINSIQQDEASSKGESNSHRKFTKKIEAKPTYTVRTTKGLAIWKKDSADMENLFALHPTARVNTMIEITNPMLNRKVLAKVIGNLPENSYPKAVQLVVSPRVASELGVIDTRFFVEIRYLE